MNIEHVEEPPRNREKIVPINAEVEAPLDQIDLLKSPAVINAVQLRLNTSQKEQFDILLDSVDLLKKARDERRAPSVETDLNATDGNSAQIISLQAERDRRMFANNSLKPQGETR